MGDGRRRHGDNMATLEQQHAGWRNTYSEHVAMSVTELTSQSPMG
jgi:hypothetical protein